MGRIDAAGASDAANANAAAMREFHTEVGALRDALKQVETRIRDIDAKYTEQLMAIAADKADEATKQMESLIRETNTLSKDIAERLKRMAAANKQLPATTPNADRRLRDSLQATLQKKFYDLMAEYQELKSRHAQRYREKVRQQVQIASGQTPDDEQLDELVAAGDANRLFATKILQDRRNQDAANALAFLTERHSDIIRLEQQMNELHQIFVDMAALVEAQGEMLDQIENNVDQAVEYVEEAVKQVEKSKRLAIRARKKKLIIALLICCCLIIVAVAIAVPLSLALKK